MVKIKLRNIKHAKYQVHPKEIFLFQGMYPGSVYSEKIGHVKSLACGSQAQLVCGKLTYSFK